MNTLLKLAQRCEDATGPDRDLDIAILLAVMGDGKETISAEKPYYTRSLDAAMTLVPEGHSGRCSWCDGAASVLIYENATQALVGEGTAATLALTLTAAALRARTALKAKGEPGL
jgi:hypothetical protein